MILIYFLKELVREATLNRWFFFFFFFLGLFVKIHYYFFENIQNPSRNRDYFIFNSFLKNPNLKVINNVKEQCPTLSIIPQLLANKFH
jgi:hypothetical protein